MLTKNKHLKLLFQLFTLLCFIGIGVCFIVDFFINKKITWAWLLAISIPTMWLIVSPWLIVKKNKFFFWLLALTIVALPYLYLLEKVVAYESGWFLAVSMPVSIITITIIWIVFLIFKYLKISLWFKSAISVFLFGVIASGSIQYYVYSFIGAGFKMMFTLNFVINTLATLGITFLLIIIGFNKRQSQENR